VPRDGLGVLGVGVAIMTPFLHVDMRSTCCSRVSYRCEQQISVVAGAEEVW